MNLMIFYLPLLFTSKPLEEVPAFDEMIRIRRHKTSPTKGRGQKLFVNHFTAYHVVVYTKVCFGTLSFVGCAHVLIVLL